MAIPFPCVRPPIFPFRKATQEASCRVPHAEEAGIIQVLPSSQPATCVSAPKQTRNHPSLAEATEAAAQMRGSRFSHALKNE